MAFSLAEIFSCSLVIWSKTPYYQFSCKFSIFPQECFNNWKNKNLLWGFGGVYDKLLYSNENISLKIWRLYFYIQYCAHLWAHIWSFSGTEVLFLIFLLSISYKKWISNHRKFMWSSVRSFRPSLTHYDKRKLYIKIKSLCFWSKLIRNAYIKSTIPPQVERQRITCATSDQSELWP